MAHLLTLKSDIAAVRLRLAIKRFNPHQPRWPAGQSDGGQWRPEGEREDSAQNEGVYDPSRIAECSAQQMLDEDLCRMVRSERCWKSSQERYNNCMKNVYVPPLEIGR